MRKCEKFNWFVGNFLSTWKRITSFVATFTWEKGVPISKLHFLMLSWECENLYHLHWEDIKGNHLFCWANVVWFTFYAVGKRPLRHYTIHCNFHHQKISLGNVISAKFELYGGCGRTFQPSSWSFLCVVKIYAVARPFLLANFGRL